MFHEVINMESYLQKLKKSYYQNLSNEGLQDKACFNSSETLILYQNSYLLFFQKSCDKCDYLEWQYLKP